MDAGLFFLFETLGQMSEAEFYRQSLDECVWGEELGFGAACPAEHHFSSHYGIMPRVELFLAWVAGRTRRMKLWPMVIVAPLRNPIQLAEDCALLDCFSEGRMVCSVGSGYRPYEFVPFGQEIAENAARLREVTEATVRLWTEPEVTYRGKYYEVIGASLQPRPVQKPHPPVYITTTREDQIRWAAERGFHVFPAAGFNAATLRHDFELHARIAREHDKPAQNVRPCFKWIYVGERHEQAVAEGTELIMRTMMAFAQGGGRLFSLMMGKAVETWPDTVPKPEWLTAKLGDAMAHGLDYAGMVKTGWLPFVCGDPAHVTEVLADCKAAGANFFVGGFKCGPMPPEKVKSSMRLFAEKVLPSL
jgi:alkanesulfonate monooxygenase SsuD/methylene tetrahydromethanopterin reductase-like flavin-dependent oxidoreductase (luciferase family)